MAKRVAPWQAGQGGQGGHRNGGNSGGAKWQRTARSAGAGEASSGMSIEEEVSRYLSRVLRHDAVSLGLSVRPDGYVRLSDLLSLEFFTSRGLDEADVQRLVASNTKQRFGIAVPTGQQELHIRAHQGHTLKSVADEALLAPVNSAEELEVLCHGTFQGSWDAILAEGLKTMGRNHIHCVAVDLTAEENCGVFLSGARGECDTVIFIDIAAAMAEGVEFHWSDNGVVLTRGHDDVLPPHLFVKVARWNYHENEWHYQDLQATA